MFLRKLLITLALLIVAIAFMNGLLDSFGNSPQFSFTLAGSFAIYLATRPAKREIAVTILVGVLLRLAFEATVGIKPYFGFELISLAGFLGTSSIIMLAYTAIRNKNFSVFGTAAFFPFVTIVVGFILPITNGLSPLTFDAHLLAVDGMLGFQPSFVLGRIINGNPHPLLWHLTAFLYYALPFPIALLCAVKLTEDVSEVRRLLCLFGVMSTAGFCIYAVCPATGPIYAFRDWFPLRPLSDIELAPLSVSTSPRNAMPSLHLSAALLVYWNTLGMRKVHRIAAGLFLGGTVFATLALGEHYLTDLIVAVPFSLMFQAAFTSSSRENSTWRYCAMAGSAALVAGWLIMLRFWIQPLVVRPAATFLFFMSTLGFSILARRQLSRQDLELSRADIMDKERCHDVVDNI